MDYNPVLNLRGGRLYLITGAAFVDLCVAYDTVKHILLIQKFSNTTHDSALGRVIQNLLSNKRILWETEQRMKHMETTA